jgi:hypothetical protein
MHNMTGQVIRRSIFFVKKKKCERQITNLGNPKPLGWDGLRVGSSPITTHWGEHTFYMFTYNKYNLTYPSIVYIK